jgi:hypothetical protein
VSRGGIVGIIQVQVRDTHGRLRDFAAFLCEEPEPNHPKLAA